VPVLERKVGAELLPAEVTAARPAFPVGPDIDEVLRGVDEQHRALTAEGLPASLVASARDLAALGARQIRAALHHYEPTRTTFS
jgi:hypothetical protein